MLKRTFGQVKSQLSVVAGTTGMPMSDDRIRVLANQAIEELMNEGDWPGVVDRYYFTSENYHIILPAFLDRIMGVAVNDRPYAMRSPWFEFVEFGPGPQNDNNCRWVDDVIDRGEIVTQKIFPQITDGPWMLYTVAALAEDADAEMIVQGTTTGGEEVRTMMGTAYASGEAFPLNGTSFGTAVFESITGVIKPETNGYIQLWATNGTTNYQLANYAPQETAPSYHEYYLPTLKDCLYGAFYCNSCCPDTNPGVPTPNAPLRILVRGRKRFVPIESDNDLLIITNIPALINMMIALFKRNTGSPDQYVIYKGAAVDIMQKEAKSYLGKVKMPPISVARGASVGVMPFLR